MKAFKSRYFFQRLWGLFFAPLLWTIDFFVKKHPKRWLFAAGFPHPFHSNQRALFDYLVRETDVEPILLLFPLQSPPDDVPLHQCVWVNTWSGLYQILSARFIVVHHGIGDIGYRGVSPKKHVILNLSHGIPLKRIGYEAAMSLRFSDRFFQGLKALLHTYEHTYTICSSLMDRLSMSACLREPFKRLLVTGLPRNDWLIGPASAQPEYFQRAFQAVHDLFAGKRLVLYAPTFRENGRSIYVINNDERQALEKVLREQNAILLVKAHINDTLPEGWVNTDSIKIFEEGQIYETQALLAYADVLITDYSGIWLDYLLTLRPILGFVFDLEDYQSYQRPLMYDFEAIFPGVLCESFENLLHNLSRHLQTSLTSEETSRYKMIRDLFHAYQDGCSCERVFTTLQARSKAVKG